MKNRKFVSLFLGGSILTLSITSVLMFLYRHSDITAAIHTTIGFLFLLFVAFHIFSNWPKLKQYSIKQKWIIKLSPALLITVFLITIVVLGINYNINPFAAVYEFGQNYRSQQNIDNKTIEIKYEVLKTNNTIAGKNISVEVTKGIKDYYSVMAIWIEDTAGNYIETLYASKNIATGIFWQEVDGEAVRISVRRPEAVPYWSHKRNIVEADGINVPTPETAIVDGITAATPKSHFVLDSKLSKSSINKFKVLYEVNRSFDWNAYYNEGAFPDDKIYSGSGSVGQPSLIYSSTIINLKDENRRSYLMDLVGHGHHSGKDGKLYSDLSNITTAIEITERVLVIIDK